MRARDVAARVRCPCACRSCTNYRRCTCRTDHRGGRHVAGLAGLDRPLPQPRAVDVPRRHASGRAAAVAGPHARGVVVQAYVQALTLPDEVRTLSALDTHAVICVMQLLGGSHVSPALDPAVAAAWAVDVLRGPHPSGSRRPDRSARASCRLRAGADAAGRRAHVVRVGHARRHLVVQLLGGSQVSPASTTLLPQTGWQSLSLVELQPDGQQPSLFAHAVCKLRRRTGRCRWRRARRDAAWQPTAVHAVGQFSRTVSPVSTTPFPQRTSSPRRWWCCSPPGSMQSFAVQAVVVAPFTQRHRRSPRFPAASAGSRRPGRPSGSCRRTSRRDRPRCCRSGAGNPCR